MIERIEVQAGQVWADNDKRSEGRAVLVLSLEESTDPFSHRKVVKAVCAVLTNMHGVPAQVGGHFPTTRINVDRMRPTTSGYRLVSGPGA